VAGNDPIRIRITSKSGELQDYGGGFLVENHRLASSFCRTDSPVITEFQCALNSADETPFSGSLEAWYRGKHLQTWSITRTCRFQAIAVLPR
jgi:hypothetical protein